METVEVHMVFFVYHHVPGPCARLQLGEGCPMTLEAENKQLLDLDFQQARLPSVIWSHIRIYPCHLDHQDPNKQRSWYVRLLGEGGSVGDLIAKLSGAEFLPGKA